jgi:DNA-binding NarL/FixJ family response regulator
VTEITVMLVDDQDLLRAGMAMVIGAQPDLRVVGEAADGATAVERDAELAADVVMMDVRMPGLDGIEATRRIIERRPDARIIVITTFDLDEYAFGALNAGASGFLLKDASPVDLVTAIRTVASGEAMISPRITRALLELYRGRLPGAGQRSTDTARLDQLTDREREVLVLMARGLSNGEIGQTLFVSNSTVKTHVGRVLAKLGLRDRVHAVIFAYEHGLI